MPRVRDLLYRFRPAGAPGAAGRAGVPVDRAAESTAELEPLFAELAATEQECTRLHAEAQRDAQEITERGQQQAQAVTVASARQAEQERAATAAQLARHGETEAQAVRRAAEAAVVSLQQRAAETMPAYVDAVVDRVVALLGRSIESAPARIETR